MTLYLNVYKILRLHLFQHTELGVLDTEMKGEDTGQNKYNLHYDGDDNDQKNPHKVLHLINEAYCVHR